MLVQIANILSPEECAAIREVLTGENLWRDGKETAKGLAKSVKANQQADFKSPAVKGILAKIELALKNNEVFKAAAQPAGFARMMISRYGAGMSYGDHVDAPYIDGQRTDLSFTVYLNDGEDYEGGELVIDNAGHEDAVKGPAGSVVVYPSSSVHRVAPVTAGERLVCVGWVKSKVRSAEHRALLFELESALADLRAQGAAPEVRNRLSNIRNNLLRLFGD